MFAQGLQPIKALGIAASQGNTRFVLTMLLLLLLSAATTQGAGRPVGDMEV
jgi:hypothetical protein